MTTVDAITELWCACDLDSGLAMRLYQAAAGNLEAALELLARETTEPPPLGGGSTDPLTSKGGTTLP